MTDYRDHPYAFMIARPSVDSMRHRAEDWRKKGFKAEDRDIAGMFDRCGNVLELARMRFANLLDLIDEEAPLDVIAESCSYIEIDHALINQSWEAGQFLRDNGFDPYGGSVASSLEVVSDEFVHLAACVDSIMALADSTGSYDAIETVVRDALELPAPGSEHVVTHEAPRMLM
jgi:hypothetical protein